MNTKNSVSVIIPNHNNAKWLPLCIESCIVQGEVLREIIVVDDHSTDQSWDVLETFSKNHPELVKIYKNPKKGGNCARNYGFEQSTGKYIQWLDSDDQILPGKFDAQVQLLEKEPQVDIVYSDWQKDFYDSGKFIGSEKIKYGPYEDFLYELIIDNWTVPCNYLLRRTIAEQLSSGFGWNPETFVGQDREYFNKAAIIGARFRYVPGNFAIYNKWSENSVSKMNFKERLKESYKLELNLKKNIQKQNWITLDDKKKYISILNAQALKATFYDPSFKLDDKFSFNQINWGVIHWKMRIVLIIKLVLGLVNFKENDN